MEKIPTKIPVTTRSRTIIFLYLMMIFSYSCKSDRPVDYVDPFICTEGDHGLDPNLHKADGHIQSATLNGEPFTRSYITHDEIVNGGKLIFVMGNEPNKNWGI